VAVDTGQPVGIASAAVAFQTDSVSIGATDVDVDVAALIGSGQHIQMVGNNVIELLLLLQNQSLMQQNQALAQQNQALAQQNQALAQQNQSLAQQNQSLAQQNQSLAHHVESSGRIIFAVLILMIIGIIIIIMNILHFTYMF
jgi:DNA anti-recombination protein RmuC